MKAIETDAPELVVSPGPFRRLTVRMELVPAVRAPVTSWIVRDQIEKVTRRHAGAGEAA